MTSPPLPTAAEVKRRVSAWIDANSGEIVDFCSRFVAYRSVTGDELEVQRDFLKPFLEKSMDWDDIDLYSLCTSRERPNLTAISKGRGNGRSLILNGHVDVIPVPENQRTLWSVDPWNSPVKDGRLYGRGSSDMKGGITSMLWAVKALMDLGIHTAGDLGIEMVVGEEEMAHEIGTTGATERLMDKGYNFDFALSTEPTYCEIHTLSSGVFSFELYVQGKTVHTSSRNRVRYPQRFGLPFGDEVGVDAIPKLMGILETLERLESEWVHSWRNPVWGAGGSPEPRDFQGVGLGSISLDVLQAGDMIGMIPGYAKATILVTHPPWVRYEDAVNEIRNAVDSYVLLDGWLKKHPPTITVKHIWAPYETDPDHPGCHALARAIGEATGREGTFSGFRAVNDMAFLQKLGISGVTMGPGDISLGCHGPDEYVPVEQMIDCAKIIAFFIVDWCGIG